jgi:mono/diheme cytochrome c family protein
MPSLVVSTVGRVQGKSVQALTMRPTAVLPVDLAANAAGDFVIAAAGTNAVEVSWPFDSAHARADAGLDLRDAGFSFADGGADNRVFLKGQPVAVVSRGDEFVVVEREPAGLAFITKGTDEPVEVALSGASVESTGHRIFHQATSANIACASCHPEAGDDEHVWQFAEGARRTPTLRGGLSQTAPFHWSGDLPTMPALVSDVMVRRMSGNRQSDYRTSALLAWLDSQNALPAPPVNRDSAARGEALFNNAQTQCASCHVGPQGTNNASTNVGTSGVFQVPRLVELGWRTQWFHDGRIATAADRFGAAGGGELHGHTSQLTAQDKADLVEYLKTR